MRCPNDDATLLMTERRGVPIDYCPECRGVWLERGRLDQLLDQSSDRDDGRHDDGQHHEKRNSDGGRRKRVSGLLGDLLGGGGD
jgi:Zn-finger nucleic acid-binding protein